MPAGRKVGPKEASFQRVQELTIQAWFDCFVRLQSDEDAKNSATKWKLTNDELGIPPSSVRGIRDPEIGLDPDCLPDESGKHAHTHIHACTRERAGGRAGGRAGERAGGRTADAAELSEIFTFLAMTWANYKIERRCYLKVKAGSGMRCVQFKPAMAMRATEMRAC